MSERLSKSRYLSGIQCEKRLWLEHHEPDKASAPSSFQTHLLDQGRLLGRLARARFEDGVLIQVDSQPLKKAVADTKAALAQGATTVFEAAFEADGAYVLVDILTRSNGRWKLIEVKSATRAKDEHLHDVAIQRYVVERAGLALSQTVLWLVNAACTFPDLSDLFYEQDVSQQVHPLLASLPTQLQRLRAVALLRQAPDVPIGPHCKSPQACPFRVHCWAFVQGRPVAFEIPRLSQANQDALRREGIVFVEELPSDFPLTPKQQAYVDALADPQVSIDKAAIAKKLSALTHPLYFFDFETFGPAVPRFDGMRPYQQFPFQFSCHILHEDGRIEHREYLHLDLSDPREPVARALVDALGDRGSIVVYYASFEKAVLQALAQALPEFRQTLLGFIERLWDQYDIFKNHYHDPAFGRSKSLKNVLPVVVPTLSYDDLVVQKGDQAQSVWHKMLHSKDEKEKTQLVDALKAYCRMDTWAMVEIHRALAQYRA